MSIEKVREGCRSLRVIVTEDEPLIAWTLEDTLQSLGFDVLGPFRSVEEASKAVDRSLPQMALLDVNLVDGDVFPVADALYLKSIPLIFHTANTNSVDLAARYRGSQVVAKPSMPHDLAAALEAASAHVQQMRA
jgi:two-component system, response regulator PdtaR